MTVANFIPKIWNAAMLTQFREQAIAANLVNRSYEGNATKGNTVHITTAVPVAVKDYKANGRTTTPDDIDSTGQDLLIDQEKNFDFYIDDIDRAQVAGNLTEYAQSAAEGLAEDADKFIFAQMVAGALAGNVTADADGLGDTNEALNVIKDFRTTFNKLHVPRANRVVVVNAEFESVLLDAAGKLATVDASGSPAGLREAVIGRLYGFTVLSSENLPTVDKAQAVALYRPAAAYVSQIEKTEAMRGQDKFSDRLRGLHVYGGKVIRPNGVAVYTDTSV